MARERETVLKGCRAQPVASYLKALAVLRLTSAACGLRAAWRGPTLTVWGGWSSPCLVDFFLTQYTPTPILSPWNGDSGFYPNHQHAALEQIAGSNDPRLASYRMAIAAARDVLAGMGLMAKPAAKDKPALLAHCRAAFPDEALPWLDACCVLSGDTPVYMPLLGSGGNDGRLDFSQNHMQQLLRCLDGSATSRANLEQSLYGQTAATLRYTDASLGQFYPGAIGGPGSGAGGWEGAPSVNPWDYVLAMEGAVAFAGSVARRLSAAAAGRERAAFPFTVRTSPVGTVAIAEPDGAAERSRAEVWLPLWTGPATWAEVSFLLAEGRAEIQGRQARTGLEFAQAAVSLGVDRGIAAFERTGLLQRNGRAFLATSLGQVRVHAFPGSDLLRDPPLVEWLQAFHAAAESKEAPGRWRTAWRQIEMALLACCTGATGKRGFQDVLIALGAVEQAVAASGRSRRPPPLQPLNQRWLEEADGADLEWLLAAAISGIGPARAVGHIREYLAPVWTAGDGRWQWAPTPKRVVWNSDAPLARNLREVLWAISLEADAASLRSLPLHAARPAPLPAIHAFLCGGLDEPRMAALILGAALIRREDPPPAGRAGAPPPPDLARAYAVLKYAFWPEELAKEVRLLPSRAILHRLEGGDIEGATALVLQQLRGRNLPVRAAVGRGGWITSAAVAERLAPALLIPIRPHREMRLWVFRDLVE